MNILHIFDQAGVACILAKYQQSHGDYSRVILSSKVDKFGIYQFYEQYIDDVADSTQFANYCIKSASDADIIHIHSRTDILFKLRKEFGRTKKILMHYHGSDIRGLHMKRRQFLLPHRSFESDLLITAKLMARSMKHKITARRTRLNVQRVSDAVLVATPDLLGLIPGAVYLPNPIDKDHFTPDITNVEYTNQKKLLTMNTETTDLELVMAHCHKHNLGQDLDIYDRMAAPMMYKDMPDFLKRYEGYVDIRYVNGKILQNLSKTALEALSCGLEVIDYNLNHHKSLPSQNDPLNVVSTLSALYSRLLANENLPNTSFRDSATMKNRIQEMAHE